MTLCFFVACTLQSRCIAAAVVACRFVNVVVTTTANGGGGGGSTAGTRARAAALVVCVSEKSC